jgi:hypothetical protein
MRVSVALVGVGSAICLAMAPIQGGANAAPSVAPAALAPTTTLDLQFNEPAGSTRAVDSSGMGHHGAIGKLVKMNGSFADWPRHPPGAGIYYGADTLVMVDDAADGSLDPGTGRFVVEVRYKSTDKFGNMIQKGQAKTVGGQVKFQQPKGVMSCMFKSPTGRAATSSKTPLNDGQWHVVTCVRTPEMVEMYVDGQFRSRTRNRTGNIDNKKPWTIGGKFDCDTSNPNTGADSCDYFPGEIDYVTFTKG